MGFLDRLFGKDRTAKKRAASEAAAADRLRGQQIAGRETGQTTDEQAGTRSRMEAEMEGQRQRRAEGTRPEA